MPFDLRSREWADALTRRARSLVGRPPLPAPVVPRRAVTGPDAVPPAWLRAGQPLILTGLTAAWSGHPVRSLATLVERFGDREVAVARTRGGTLCHDARTGLDYEVRRLADFAAALQAGDPGWYVTAPVEKYLPGLLDGLDLPLPCRDAPWRRSRVWLGAAGTGAPLHRDLADNLFVQLDGRKRFLLFPPRDTPWLYSHAFLSGLPNFSRFDAERPNFERFPHARLARPAEVVLAPGEALVLPSLWWHQVRTLDVSLSLNVWWAEGVAGWTARGAEWFKRVRGLEL